MSHYFPSFSINYINNYLFNTVSPRFLFVIIYAFSPISLVVVFSYDRISLASLSVTITRSRSLSLTSLIRFALLTYTPIFFSLSLSYARYTVDDDVTRRSMSGGVKIGCQIVSFSFCGRATFISRSREFQSKIKHKSAQGDTFWMTLFLSLFLQARFWFSVLSCSRFDQFSPV